MYGTGHHMQQENYCCPPREELGGMEFYGNDYFEQNVPFTASLRHFEPPSRVRIVALPLFVNIQRGARFHINLITDRGNIFLHFNPRKEERCIVRNSMYNGSWQREQREGGWPFDSPRDRVFTFDFIAEPSATRIMINGEFFVDHPHCEDPRSIRGVEIMGDVEIHCVNVVQR